MQLFVKRLLFIVCVLFFNSIQPLCHNQIECSLLHCNAFDIQLHAGIAPIVWHSDNPDKIPAFPSSSSTVLQVFDRPKFKTLFNMPWVLGMQIGYACNENVRIYLECNYLEAKGKKEALVLSATMPSFEVKLSPQKFRLIDGYVGSQFYWGRWCNQLAFFLGAKIGVTHHYALNFDLGVAPGSFLTDIPLIKANTVVSGGLNWGMDICFCQGLSLVLTGEIVFSAAPKSDQFNSNFVISERFNTIFIGNMNAEIRFPITAGLRYSF